ncbi:hypothetical protein [uncultured Akkermansia sp.]|uniref:hypothetical protein n=1 Tax=uncultured Akkermansia sp. TaxID=512294 RepID=UPI00265D482E|nr:hypothetical protein [uncultured Akkermansia sp.]
MAFYDRAAGNKGVPTLINFTRKTGTKQALKTTFEKERMSCGHPVIQSPPGLAVLHREKNIRSESPAETEFTKKEPDHMIRLLDD